MCTEERKHIFTWKVENLNLYTQKKGTFFQSPIFKAKSLYDSQWCIDFYPRGSTKSEEGWMAYSLRRCGNDGPSEIQCNFEIVILDAEENILFSKTLVHKFQKDTEWGWTNVLDSSKLFSKNPFNDDFIIVRCEMKENAQKCPLRSENTGVTKVDINQYSFKCIVNNLNSSCSEVIKFPFAKTSDFEITVQVPEDDVKIMISRTGNLTDTQSLSCQISVLDIAGHKHVSKYAANLFEANEDGWVFPTFLKRSKLNSERKKYLRNDCFTLQFEMKLSNGTHSETIEYKESTSLECIPNTDDTDTLNTLEENMKRLFRDKNHADIKLLVDGETILAHKSILSLTSPVFSAMFNSELKENETGSVNISDLEAETVNSLLEYMYTGTLENLDHETALKLLVASDKYQVLALKEKCAKLLKSTLSDTNVCDVLVVADLVQHAVLVVACTNYIKDNSECIFFSDDWKLVIEKNLQLAMKIVTEVSKLMVAGQKKNDK